MKHPRRHPFKRNSNHDTPSPVLRSSPAWTPTPTRTTLTTPIPRQQRPAPRDRQWQAPRTAPAVLPVTSHSLPAPRNPKTPVVRRASGWRFPAWTPTSLEQVRVGFFRRQSSRRAWDVMLCMLFWLRYRHGTCRTMLPVPGKVVQACRLLDHHPMARGILCKICVARMIGW